MSIDDKGRCKEKPKLVLNEMVEKNGIAYSLTENIAIVSKAKQDSCNLP